MTQSIALEAAPAERSAALQLQSFGQIRPMPIALDPGACAENASALNAILADTMVLNGLYRKHHWVLRGHTFFQLHILFEQHSEALNVITDQIAERVQTLGGLSVADPRHVAELTVIERPPDGLEPLAAMLSRLLDAHETVIRRTRAAAEAAASNGDWGTNDLLVGGVLRTNELQAWFVAEHLADEPLPSGA